MDPRDPSAKQAIRTLLLIALAFYLGIAVLGMLGVID
jgi:hypothetical protein